MQTFTFTTQRTEDKDQNGLRLIFQGNLTLQNAGQIKALLKSQDIPSEHCQIVAKDVAGMDVSFLQIVEAYKEHLRQEGKKVSVIIDLPYDLKTLMVNAGIEYPAR
ncbi:MAG: hypothetical protein ACK4VN_05735 [Bacteroidales bacterium]